MFASLLLAGGRLADVWGRKRLFLIGLAIFTGASLAAGFAGNVDVLVDQPRRAGPRRRAGHADHAGDHLGHLHRARGSARPRSASGARVGALALAVGPLLGGAAQPVPELGLDLLHQRAGRPGDAGAGAPSRSGSRARAPAPRRLDLPGVITSAAALFALTFALIEGHDRGWTSPVILGCFAVARRPGRGLRPARAAGPPSRWSTMSLFRERVFTGGLIALMMWGFGLFGIYFFTSLYLQGVLGFSPTEAGAAFVPMALLMAAGAVISERVSHRLGAHRVVAVAMLLMAAGIASVSLLGADAGFSSLMPSFAVIGIGGGLTVPLTASVLDAMPRGEAGVASGIFNASREVAGLLGITVIGAVLTARQAVAADRR